MEPAEPRGRGGCGVEGCLFAAVALFVLLLVGLLIVAVFRFSRPPVPRLGLAAPAPLAATPAEGPALEVTNV